MTIENRETACCLESTFKLVIILVGQKVDTEMDTFWSAATPEKPGKVQNIKSVIKQDYLEVSKDTKYRPNKTSAELKIFAKSNKVWLLLPFNDWEQNSGEKSKDFAKLQRTRPPVAGTLCNECTTLQFFDTRFGLREFD